MSDKFNYGVLVKELDLEAAIELLTLLSKLGFPWTSLQLTLREEIEK